MATDPPRPAARNYWQLPTFVAGLAAAAAAFAAFPPPPTDPAVLARRDLAAFRPLLDRKPPDLAVLEAATRRAAAAADADPAVATEASFLAGCGFVAVAELGPPTDAPDRWAAAARAFAKVDPAALPDPVDAKRFGYRSAKAKAATGQGDPRVLLAALSSPPPGEEDGERARLLAEVCLKVDPPELKRARDELTAYLGAPARLPASSLARLKLQLAQIHAALTEPDRARTWLREVGASAPPDVQAAAKVQLARLADQEGNWAEAVKLYEAAQATPGLPADDRGTIRYLTAVGLLKLKNPTAAAAYFEQALNDAGPVASAAAVRLAELALRDPAGRGRRGKAVDLLETAVKGVGAPAEFGNPHVTVPELQAAFEEAVQIGLNEGDFATAVRAANVYAKVAAAGRDRERRAEVNAAWAAALQVGGGAQAAEAASKLKDAAADYASLAENYPTPAGRADLLRRSADCLRRAGDLPGAVAAIEKVTTAAGVPADAAAAAWLDKGDLLLASHQYPQAEAAFQKAIEAPGPTATAARVKLALVYVEQAREKLRAATTADAQAAARKQIDFAQDLLAQVANKAADVPAERDAQQQALFELGKLLLGQAAFADAEARFRQLVQLNPSGPLADQARLYLGSCLLLIARGDHQGGRPPADADRKLAEARTLFETLAAGTDPFLRTQADVRLANATLLMRDYAGLVTLCDKLAERYRGRVEELIVLSMLYSGQRYADRNADAARTLDRMEAVYAKLTPADFPGGAEEYTRDYWQKHWFDVLKPKAP